MLIANICVAEMTDITTHLYGLKLVMDGNKRVGMGCEWAESKPWCVWKELHW